MRQCVQERLRELTHREWSELRNRLVNIVHHCFVSVLLAFKSSQHLKSVAPVVQTKNSVFLVTELNMSPKLTVSQLNGFPENFHPSGKIATVAFIEASNEVIAIIESFGRLFSPIVSDMRGNASRLLAHYKEDEKSREFIEDMVLADESRCTHSWLLWLKRALEMMERFFWLLLNNEEIVKEKTDNIRPCITRAYDDVLKPYHGFFLQNASKVS